MSGVKVPEPRIVVSIIAVIVIAAVILALFPGPSTQTTSTTTAVQQVNLSRISACEQINKPGTYYLMSDINYSSTSGACISVVSSNVRLVGNQHTITGSGPYTGLPPYSYGIAVQNVSNVTVTALRALRFSYDLFVNNSIGTQVISNNFTTSTLAGIYLLNSVGGTVQENSVSNAQSTRGGIFLSGGGGNKVFNNSIYNNAYYGIVVNSTGNNFTRNTFGSNAADLVCNLAAASSLSNVFSDSKCAINDYCGFASCSINVPFNISSIRLAPGSVNSCGTIYSPGNYVLSKSVSASAYLNTSNPLSKSVACIQILAPNVNFDCANKQINNSGYGIYIGPSSNVNVSGCTFTKDTYGVFATSAFNPKVSNSTARDNTYGVYITNTTGGGLSNVNLTMNNTYGLFVNSSSGLLLDGVKAQNNTYGIYMNSGESNVFSGGVATNNTEADLYCSANTYNSTTNLAQSISCGVTDCSWASASCKQTVQPQLSVYPVTSCKTITDPGTYALSQNVIDSGTCFNIESNNVGFNCNSHLLVGSSQKSAFYVANRQNVSISNCIITGFNVGVNVTNSSSISIDNLTVNSPASGVRFSRVSASSVSNVKVTGQSFAAYNFTNVNTSTIKDNIAFGGSQQGSGFLFTNSRQNQITLNNATENPVFGFSFANSRNNTVSNNSASSNKNVDYSCSGSSTGLYSNPLGINSGLTKSQCAWMVVQSPLTVGPTCQAVFSPSQIVLGSDMVYSSGSTCFSAYRTNSSSANSTLINCAGHTVYALHGGTFADVVGASGVKVYNCLLLNFSVGVQSSNSISLSVFNNTFQGGGVGVMFNDTKSASVYKNAVYNNTDGLLFYNTTSSKVYNNLLFNNTVGLGFYGGSSPIITNNTARNSSTGLLFNATRLANIQDNTFLNSSQGAIVCVGSAANLSSSNGDGGGNICQNASSTCSWISASPSCKA